MKIVPRVLFSVIVALILSACVLSSKEPKFAPEDGAVPIAADIEFDAYTKDAQGWKKEAEIFSFKRDGNVYLMSDGKNLASVIFVELNPEWFAAQYRERDGLYYYGLVKTAGNEVEVTSLPCDKLKQLLGATPAVTFSGEDCVIDAIADPKSFFAALIDKLEAPEMKLVPRP